MLLRDRVGVNLTLALIAGLVLLLPGLTGLAFWTLYANRHGAKRPELQLTSISALFAVLTISLLTHIIGFSLTQGALASLVELGPLMPKWWPVRPVPVGPYDTILNLAFSIGRPSPNAIEVLVTVIVLQCLLVIATLGSDGLDLLLNDIDLRSQGWVFQHILRPSRHGYTPIATVMTIPNLGDYGIGYKGVVADLRQDDGGRITSISLAEPQRFVYRVKPAADGAPATGAAFDTSDREWIGGVVSLDATGIRHIIVQNIAPGVLNPEAIAAAAEAAETGSKA